MQKGKRRQSVMDGLAEQFENWHVMNLALNVTQAISIPNVA
jgi:hypothetical protein